MKIKEQAIELENKVEEQVNGALNRVQDATRKSFFAYLGIWGVAYDGAVGVVDYSKRMFNKAVERGSNVEQSVREEAQGRVANVEDQASEVRDHLKKRWRDSEQELESQIEAALNRLELPSQSSLTALNDKIDRLNDKIDGLLVTEETEIVVAQPLPDYDKFTAKKIVGMLDKLTIEELVQVKQYEMAHENRVTVLREVDSLLEEMPIARYDELTVEEIEPLLATLDVAQLKVVAEYEAAHENRVTLLRAIESELENRETAVA